MVFHNQGIRFLLVISLICSLTQAWAQVKKTDPLPKDAPAKKLSPTAMDPSKWPVGPDGKRYAPFNQTEKEAPKLPDLKPEAPFITINGESLTWGALHAHLDLLISNTRLPAGVTAKDLEAERANLIMGRLNSVVRNYALKTLLAQEARARGVVLTEKEVTEKQNTILTKIKSARGSAKRYLDVFNQPGSFFHADLTNSLLLQKFDQEILLPSIVITDADIDAALRTRNETNRGLTETNVMLRPTLQAMRKEIMDGKDTFSNLAFLKSECGSSIENGEFGTTKCEDLLPELITALTNLTVGAVSEVVETPFSFHLLKLNKINYGFLKEGDKGPAPVVSIDFAHIMLEKKVLLPDITRDALKKELIETRKIEKRDALLDTLIAKAKIECTLKLNLKPRASKKGLRKAGPTPAQPEE